MKIAVMFGSFNPFANAHMAAMKTAVETLQADKGLFVATNGKYLRRKTVKRNDPFYLTENLALTPFDHSQEGGVTTAHFRVSYGKIHFL